MRLITCLFVACLTFSPVLAGTSVYRCIGPDGETLFSQTDCGAGATVIDATPVQAIGEGLRPAERKALRVTSTAKGRRDRQAAAKDARRTDEAASKQRYRCTRARQQLASVQAERRRGYPAGKGRKLRERQARYEAYLDSFCS